MLGDLLLGVRAQLVGDRLGGAAQALALLGGGGLGGVRLGLGGGGGGLDQLGLAGGGGHHLGDLGLGGLRALLAGGGAVGDLALGLGGGLGLQAFGGGERLLAHPGGLGAGPLGLGEGLGAQPLYLGLGADQGGLGAFLVGAGLGLEGGDLGLGGGELLLGGGVRLGELLLGGGGEGDALFLGLGAGLLGLLGGGAQQAFGVGLGAQQRFLGAGLGLAAGGVDVGGGLGAGLVGERGSLGADGGHHPLGLDAGLLEQALRLLLGAGAGLLRPVDVLVDVAFCGGPELGEFLLQPAAPGVELGFQLGGALGGLRHHPLGRGLGFAELAFGVGAERLRLHLGVAQDLFGLAGDGVEGARLRELPAGLVELGPQHLHLVGEVVGVLDGLVPLLAGLLQLGLELGEVILNAVVAPHSAVPSISWSRPRPGPLRSLAVPGVGPVGPCNRSAVRVDS